MSGLSYFGGERGHFATHSWLLANSVVPRSCRCYEALKRQWKYHGHMTLTVLQNCHK